MRRMSLVAVCCSSASFSSSNSRTFSIAITAWSAKRFDQLDLFGAEWQRFGTCPGVGRALDIIEHLAAAPAIAADDVAMTAATQISEVLARHHAAIANEHDALEP